MQNGAGETGASVPQKSGGVAMDRPYEQSDIRK